MKKKILRIINSLNPKYGGPAVAIIDSSVELINNGHKVDILTNDPENSNFHKIKKIKVINLGSGIGNYSFNYKLFLWLLKNKNKYDNFIIHGIWEFHTLIARILLKKKYFVFIHGQLDPFFEKQFFKKIKKKIYWFLFEKKNLIFSKSLLLTSKIEKKLIKNTYVNTDGIKKKVVDYGILEPKLNLKKSERLFYTKFKKLKNVNYFIYLGRFHKKKGCEIILGVLAKLKKNKIKIKVLIAGPNNEYKKKLIEDAYKLRIDDMIVWSDTLIHDLKWIALKKSEAMILPSHGENFGVSLVETMSLSKPVITTTKVNIYDKIISTKAGIITSNNLNSFYKGVIKFLRFSKKQKKRLSKNSYLCFSKYFNLENNLESFKDLIK